MSNVRAGDLAVVVWSRSPQNVGLIVRVLHGAYAAVGDLIQLPDGENVRVARAGLKWLVESAGRPIETSLTNGTKAGPCNVHVFSDRSLRPLRETDTPDEMIAIAGPAPEHGRIREWEGKA